MQLSLSTSLFLWLALFHLAKTTETQSESQEGEIATFTRILPRRLKDTTGPYNLDEKRTILDFHNYVRQQIAIANITANLPGARNMVK